MIVVNVGVFCLCYAHVRYTQHQLMQLENLNAYPCFHRLHWPSLLWYCSCIAVNIIGLRCCVQEQVLQLNYGYLKLRGGGRVLDVI